MIALIGDVHGNFGILAALVAKLPPGCEVIQVGDFGFWKKMRRQYVVPDRDVRFVDGNHDHVDDLIAGKCDWPNAFYMERGEVREIDGRRILFLGGATSVDRAWRPKINGFHAWFPSEVIQPREVERALDAARGGVDLMVTHSPPDWMIRKHFSPDGLRSFGIDPDTWRDLSAEAVEKVWRVLNEPPLICGHMHRSVKDGKCRILDINEVMVI